MMLSNVIVDVTIPRCSFVFGQSRAKVCASFSNVVLYCQIQNHKLQKYFWNVIVLQEKSRSGVGKLSHMQQQLLQHL